MIKQVRGNPSRWIKRRNTKIDFTLPRLSHSVVKEAEHLRFQELLQRIESHPHRAALQADLQQNNVYNPFSKESEEMIRELGNVELFELCETTSKSTMFPMFSLLESRTCVLHLRTMLDLQRIQETGCNLYPGLRDQERRYPWCSTRQDRSAKRIPHGLECEEEMM